MENNGTFSLNNEHKQQLIENDRRRQEQQRQFREQNENIRDSFLDETFQSSAQSAVMATENARKLARILDDEDTTRDLKLNSMQLKRLEQIRLKGAHTMLFGLSGSDSPEMLEIKRYARRLDDFMEKERKSRMTNEIFDELDLNLQLVAAACDTYLSNPKKRENRRKAVVREYFTACRFQIDRMTLMRREAKEAAGGKNDYELNMAYDLETHLGMDKEEVIRAARERKARNAQANVQENAQQPAVKAGMMPVDMAGHRDSVIGDPSEMSKELKGIAKIFGEDYKISDSLKAAGKKERAGMAKTALELMAVLRSIPRDTVMVKNITLVGTKLRILQRSDNSLSVLEGDKEFPMPCSISTLLDRMEIDMVRNQECYGDTNMFNYINGIDLSQYEEGSAAYEFKRQQICEYLKEKTGVEVPSLDSIPDPELKDLALLACSQMVLNPKKEVLNRIKQLENEALKRQNSSKALKSRKYREEHEKDAVQMPEAEDRFDEENPEVIKEWNYNEGLMVNLFADMISDSQSFAADDMTKENVSKGEALRRRMGRHTEAISAFIEDPEYVNRFLDRLPLPNIRMEDGRTIHAYLKDEVAKIQDSGVVQLLRNMFFGRGIAINSLFGGDSIPFIYSSYKDEFEKLAETIDDMVNNICTQMQTAVSEEADKIFGKDPGEQQAELGGMREADPPEEIAEEPQEEPQTLKGIMESLTKGKKGQGRFNKLILKGYFKDSDIMEKRSMLASMMRSAKPREAYDPTDDEAINGLIEEDPRYVGNYFRDRDNLSRRDRMAIEDYKKRHRGEEMAGALLGGMLKGAGPLMQKVMQGMPMAGVPKSLKRAIKDMKSNLLPIPEQYVKDVMNGIIERSNKAIKKIEVQRALGAATVGQAFLCKIYGKKYPEGKDVVIKVLRPDAKNRMEREKRIMREYARRTDESGGMLETFEGQLESYEKELDLTLESRNVDLGKHYYEGKDAEVTSMRIVHDVEAGQDFLLAEKAEGTTVDRYLEDIDKKIQEIHDRFREEGRKKMSLTPENALKLKESTDELLAELKRLEKRRDNVCKLSSTWVKEGMMGSGFYHADLHSGNIMITDEKVTVIDYGNAVKLTGNQQKWISAMLAAASTSDTELFFESFDELLDKSDEKFRTFYTEEKKMELRGAFGRILAMGDTTETGQRIMACFLKAQELGVKVPAAVYNFSQGQLRLMNTVDEMNAKINTIKQAVYDMSRMNVEGKSLVNPHHLMAERVRQDAMKATGAPNYPTYWKNEAELLEGGKKKLFIDSAMATSGLHFQYYVVPQFMGKTYELTKSGVFPMLRNFGFEQVLTMIRNAKNTLTSGEDIDDFSYRVETGKLIKGISELKDYSVFMDHAKERRYNGLSYHGLMDILREGDIEGLNGLEKLVTNIQTEILKSDQLRLRVESFKAAYNSGKKEAMRSAANEIYDLSVEIDKLKGVKEKSLFEEVRENLSLEGLSMEEATEKDNRIVAELQGMFSEQQDNMGQQLRTAFDNMRQKEAADVSAEEKEQARDRFMDMYKRVAAFQLKRQAGIYSDPKAMEVDKNDFINVMGRIFSDPWLIVKTAWRVGGSLGYRIYKSESRAEAQRKAEKALKKKEEEDRKKKEEEEELKRLEEEDRKDIEPDSADYLLYEPYSRRLLVEANKKNKVPNPENISPEQLQAKMKEVRKKEMLAEREFREMGVERWEESQAGMRLQLAKDPKANMVIFLRQELVEEIKKLREEEKKGKKKKKKQIIEED